MTATARSKTVYRKACEFLLESGTDSLPVNPAALIQKARFGLVTYSGLCERVGIASVRDLCDACGSGDGFTVFNGRNYCIAYNDTVAVKSRIAFTLMHEAGHIVCGHFGSGAGGGLLSGEQYAVYEREADAFASNVLAPAAVIRACGLFTPEQLRAACCISFEAAARRLRELAHYTPAPADAAVLKAFDRYIAVTRRRMAPLRPDISFEQAVL